MAISKSRKRYQLSLTPSNVERFQNLVKRMGLPPGTMSQACDDVIRDLSETFERALEKGSFELSDLMKLMGQQLELLEEEKKEVQRVSKQKSNSVPHAKKHA